MLDSLVVSESLLSIRIKVDEFNTIALLKIATRSITQDADNRASASWSQHSSIVSQSAWRPYKIIPFNKMFKILLFQKHEKEKK